MDLEAIPPKPPIANALGSAFMAIARGSAVIAIALGSAVIAIALGSAVMAIPLGTPFMANALGSIIPIAPKAAGFHCPIPKFMLLEFPNLESLLQSLGPTFLTPH